MVGGARPVPRLGCSSPALSMSLSTSREPDERCSRLMLRLKLEAGLTSESGVRASNRDQRTNLTTEYLDPRTQDVGEKAAARWSRVGLQLPHERTPLVHQLSVRRIVVPGRQKPLRVAGERFPSYVERHQL